MRIVSGDAEAGTLTATLEPTAVLDGSDEKTRTGLHFLENASNLIC